MLRLRGAAPPDRGKANAAVTVLLGKALGVPKSAIAVTAGETARFKTVAITGDGALLAGRLEAITAPQP